VSYLSKPQGRPPKTEKQKAIELIKQQIEQQGKPDATAIAKATGYHPVHVRRLIKEVQRQMQTPETETKTVTPTVEIEKAEVIPQAEPIPLTPEEAVKEAISEGEWTEDNLYGLINMVDALFPEDCRHTEQQNRALAKAWVKPFNRLLEKYMEKNADLYIALVVSALWVLPSVAKIVAKRRKPKEPTKEGEKNVKTA
jgi:hypothetical protein